MDEKKNSSLTTIYVFILLAAGITSVVYAWHDTIVENNFELILPDEGIENIEVEE